MEKILVVEDHADIRKLIRLTLEFEAFDIYEAVDAPIGLAIAVQTRPRIVLMDVMMPGAFDGLEACRRIKAHPLIKDTIVVLLSARGQSPDREAGLQAGADAYLVKPFSPLQLIETLDRLLALADH